MSALREGRLNGRWAVGALAWTTLSAATWFAGDALVIAGERPLDRPAARLAFIAVVAAIWLARELWRARRSLLENQRLLDGLVSGVANADSAERAAHELSLLRKRFEDALLTLRKARFGGPAGERRTLAELPWYTLIGAPGSGKTTALLNAGLRFPLGDPRAGEVLHGIGGTRNCDWWFTDEAVLLDTAGRYTTQESDREADAAAWLGFLDLLKQFRAPQPLNGALVTLSVSDLVHWNDEELARYAAHVRERIKELYERLGARIPVYVLVTKSDLLAGFNEFFSELDAERRAQVWGMTFDATAVGGASGVATRFEEEFARLERRLYALLAARLQEERDLQRRAAIYRFPQQFRVSGPLVSRFLAAVFGANASRETPLVRGVYFTSGTQEGSPIDRVLGTLARSFHLERKVQPPAPGTGRSFFLKRLLREVIFAEAGLAGVDAKAERRSRRALVASCAAVLAVAAAVAVLWTAGYFANRALVARAGAQAAALARDLEDQPPLRSGEELRLLTVLDRMGALRAQVAPQATLLRVGFSQADKLGAQAERSYRNLLRESLLPYIVFSLEEALRRRPSREVLQAYLSLYDRPDASLLQPALMRCWKLPRQAAPRLGSHLSALLEERPLDLPHRRDERLVEAARRALGPGLL